MKRPQRAAADPRLALRSLALQYPETEEGIACAGTTLEKRTLKVRGKAFLFLGAADAMLKLGDSLAEASDVAARHPDHCRVGSHGWVTLILGNAAALPADLLARWVDESYRLLAPKKLVAALPESVPAGTTKTTKPAKRKPATRKSATRKPATRKRR